MAQYTITINDDDDLGVTINLSGSSKLTDRLGPAARLALSLATIAPSLLKPTACSCEQCQADRAQATSTPTIH